jgi:hypothetical protein
MSNKSNDISSRDPNIHIDACRERNRRKNNPVNMRCGTDLLHLQHQYSWRKLPKTIYRGKKGGETLSMNCANGYRNKPVKNVCPIGYKFSAVRNTTDGCRKFFKKCDQYPIYNFNYTHHSVNPDDIDNQDHERLAYELPPPLPSQNSINNISNIENGTSHKYTNNSNECKKCKKHCG